MEIVQAHRNPATLRSQRVALRLLMVRGTGLGCITITVTNGEEMRAIICLSLAVTLAACEAQGSDVGAGAQPTEAATVQTKTSEQSSQLVQPAFLGDDAAKVAANEQVVVKFMQDVLDEHHGDHAGLYLTADMQWHGGTVGTVAGSTNVGGLMTQVVTSIPDLYADVKDIFGQGNQVVVRLVVSGTLRGPLLGIAGSGRPVQWDAIDLYQLRNGKISEEWAGEDFTAFLNDTGTYKAHWIP